MKKALIFGMSGQAGSYLAEFLLEKDYEVVGTHCNHNLRQIGDGKWCGYLIDIRFPGQIERIIEQTKPDEVYNLAAKMFAPASWDDPFEYMQVNALAVAKMLEVLFEVNPDAKFFQAGSADVFDRVYPCDELTPIRPRSPYGVSKAAAQELVRVYREEKHRFAVTGILFNMESLRRPTSFFSTKVITSAVRIHTGKQDKLKLGRLDAVRDWGLTEEYVKAMWLMLQTPNPKDYVIGSGEMHNCLEFVVQAFRHAGVPLYKVEWDHFIPIEEDIIVSNPTKIYDDLGWRAKVRFNELIKHLVIKEFEACGESLVTR